MAQASSVDGDGNDQDVASLNNKDPDEEVSPSQFLSSQKKWDDDYFDVCVYCKKQHYFLGTLKSYGRKAQHIRMITQPSIYI